MAQWFGRTSCISEFPISSLASNGQLGFVQDNPSFNSSVALTHGQLVCRLPVKILKMGWLLLLSDAHWRDKSPRGAVRPFSNFAYFS